jgi:hypothetical protein
LPRDWRSRHVGEYDRGWDALRQERLKRQVELGIVPAGTTLAERMWFVPDPVLLAPTSRAVLGKKMELYAGMRLPLRDLSEPLHCHWQRHYGVLGKTGQRNMRPTPK